jgi:hypothetical protein
MLLKITKKIGNTTITADVETGSDMSKALVGADWLLNSPEKCSVCGGTHLRFSARGSVAKNGDNAGKTFYYTRLICQNPDCRATATVGKFNDGSGYFWRDGGVFEKYNAPQSNTARPQQAPPDDDDGENVPF